MWVRLPLSAPYVAVAELAYASVSNTLFSGFELQRQYQTGLWRNWQTGAIYQKSRRDCMAYIYKITNDIN